MWVRFLHAGPVNTTCQSGGMVYTADLKSAACKGIRVRVPSLVPKTNMQPLNSKLVPINWFRTHQKHLELSGVDGLWLLKNFLVQSIYDQIKHEIRHVPAQWHNNYGNRHLSENGNYPVLTELAARLIPHLNHLLQEDLMLITVRTYIDLSGSSFFPHLDSKGFVANVQIYMADLDYPELGTQFCTNAEINSKAESLTPDEIGEGPYNKEDFFTVPFRQNWGYINDNRQRKIHKTLPVPLGTIRESVHFNYGLKSHPDEVGLEAQLFNNEQWYNRFIRIVRQQYERHQD